ncbi:hypothetical protein TRIP_C21269 [Candidatus Zixiibacteriota bacterium]|nr:hypothetical protein TRIP_C21269 [candidate division Zixibacteria bacterium]
MISAGYERKAIDGKLTRCAVFKIDLKGRFVYLDDLAEDLLLSPKECLFGHSVKGFLTEESYNTLNAILSRARHYETFFEAVDLEIIDAQKVAHPLRGIVSLNFVAGNPSNYQIILIPTSREEFFHTPEGDLNGRLYDFISDIETNFDWNDLAGLIREYAGASQVGVYEYADERLRLLGSSADLEFKDNRELMLTESRHVEVTINRKPVSMKEPDEAESREVCYPTVCGEACWGIIRILYKSGVAGPDDALVKASRLIGKSLFMYV